MAFCLSINLDLERDTSLNRSSYKLLTHLRRPWIKNWSLAVFFLTFQRHLTQLTMIFCYRNSIDMVYVEILSDGLKTTYTKNHNQVIKIGDTISSGQTIIYGIPQGSTLAPLLFLLYIIDLPNCPSKLSFRIFADDTNMFYTINNLHNLESVMIEEFKSVSAVLTSMDHK